MMVPIWSEYLRFRAKFDAVLDHRLYTIHWLDQRILGGDARFWSTDKAAIVAEVRHYPTGARDIHGLIAAGDLDDIRGVLIPAAEDWARSIGCLGAIIESRAGWARALKTDGYELHQTTVRKELTQ